MYSLGRPAVLRVCSTARTYVCGFSLSLSLPLLSATFAWGEEREEGGSGERSGQPHSTLGEERGEERRGRKYILTRRLVFSPPFFSRFFAGHECTHTLGFSSPKVSLRKDSARRREIELRCETRICFRTCPKRIYKMI